MLRYTAGNFIALVRNGPAIHWTNAKMRGSGAALDNFAAAARYQKEAVVTIPDRFGRPTVDIFRFKP